MKISIQNHAKQLLTAGLFLIVYIPTLTWMWDRWFARDSYYSHGILIPFVSGYLIWQKREELSKIAQVRSAWGIPLIVLGLALHLVSSLFRVYFTSGFSMLIVLVGLILFFYGAKVLRAVLFPVMFLVFMFPVPLVIITNISFKMKIFAAKIATGMLNAIGLAAVQAGSMIRMKSTQVVVDDVCSGLRSLISLGALGAIFAYWMKAAMWRRVLLFLSTVPIAVATNVVRVIILASVSEIWGPEHAEGFVHDATGFLVFALAFVLLYAVGKILE